MIPTAADGLRSTSEKVTDVTHNVQICPCRAFLLHAVFHDRSQPVGKRISHKSTLRQSQNPYLGQLVKACAVLETTVEHLAGILHEMGACHGRPRSPYSHNRCHSCTKSTPDMGYLAVSAHITNATLAQN